MTAPTMQTCSPPVETIEGEKLCDEAVTAIAVNLCTGDELFEAVQRASVTPYRLRGFCRKLQKALKAGR